MSKIKPYYYSLLAATIFFIALLVIPSPLYIKAWTVYISIYALVVLIPITLILLLSLLIQNIQSFGFKSGVKESSPQIFLLLFLVSLVYGMYLYTDYQHNKLSVTFLNKTEVPIRYIKLLGRDAISTIDSLAPQQTETIIFRGKDIQYNIANDYENEVYLKYSYGGKYRTHPILKEFNRWYVVQKNWEIHFINADSVAIYER